MYVLSTALSQLLSALHALPANHCHSLRSLESATDAAQSCYWQCPLPVQFIPLCMTSSTVLDFLHYSFVCAWLDSQLVDLTAGVAMDTKREA